MRELKRTKHLKIDGDLISRLVAVLEDSGGEVSTRMLANKYGFKARVVREAACRYPDILQLNLVHGRLPNAVRLIEKSAFSMIYG